MKISHLPMCVIFVGETTYASQPPNTKRPLSDSY